jgi:hypothetical protein
MTPGTSERVPGDSRACSAVVTQPGRTRAARERNLTRATELPPEDMVGEAVLGCSWRNGRFREDPMICER